MRGFYRYMQGAQALAMPCALSTGLTDRKEHSVTVGRQSCLTNVMVGLKTRQTFPTS